MWYLWRKYQIEIHSESIRTIPIRFDICIRANANHSEPIQKTFCISFDEKQTKNRSDLIRFNPRQLTKWIRTNPKPSFQCESIPAWIQISEWIGIVLIGSEWIPIRYFRRGKRHYSFAPKDTLIQELSKVESTIHRIIMSLIL